MHAFLCLFLYFILPIDLPIWVFLMFLTSGLFTHNEKEIQYIYRNIVEIRALVKLPDKSFDSKQTIFSTVLVLALLKNSHSSENVIIKHFSFSHRATPSARQCLFQIYIEVVYI